MLEKLGFSSWNGVDKNGDHPRGIYGRFVVITSYTSSDRNVEKFSTLSTWFSTDALRADFSCRKVVYG